MSAKWVRSQQWDDRHLTGALWPVKVLVRLFSWISTAIVLLVCVAIFGILASVPIGLLAKVPTILFYAATLLAMILGIAVLPTWLTDRSLAKRQASQSKRFLLAVAGIVMLTGAAGTLWWLGLWPHLRYDPTTGTGVRFFGAFIDKYTTVQFRRLPMMEMSELEFYAWWPLRVVLLLFVVNLVVATIRRIEFTFPRIGVLMVHTGIVTIALGSVYYTSHKQEGDMILLASGGTDMSGRPLPPRGETGFYDNTRTALWVTQNTSQGWDQRPLNGVPRYNDYNLDVVPRSEPRPSWAASLGPIDVAVPAATPGLPIKLIDDDIAFRIVGYASYAELVEQWLSPSVAGKSAAIGGKPERVRMMDLVVTMPLPDGSPPVSKSWKLFPDHPAGRIEDGRLGVEYTLNMPEQRWSDLSVPIPSGSAHALLVEVPSSGVRNVYSVKDQQTVTVGETGYTLIVRALLPQPPMPIVTKGYEGATSSIAIVHVDPPPAAGGKAAGFDRWVYSRFPEISQDMLDEKNDRGMPKRRDADPGIRITYIDASKLNVWFDERPDGNVRALVRPAADNAKITPSMKIGDQVDIAPVAAIKLGSRIDDAVRVEVPEVVPDQARDRQRIGNHQGAAIAVEVRTKSGVAGVYWVPFSQYLSLGRENGGVGRDVRLPDGRQVSIAFGRTRHEFEPPMAVALHEFEMIPYEHSDTPKDYRSDVTVTTDWPQAGAEQRPDGKWVAVRRTSLNNPLLIVTPYIAPPEMPFVGRIVGQLFSLVAPNQYKFAQAGWDQTGWRDSQELVNQGRMAKPMARFTILGVGNNPGIYIIAAGAIMMCVGIPWAFYLKPWLMQREKRKIQERLLREGKLPGPGSSASNAANAARIDQADRTTSTVEEWVRP